MTSATIEQPKIEERAYICGLSPLAPQAFFEVPVSRDRIEEGDPVPRKSHRAIQFALKTVHYQGPDDLVGIPRFGRREVMTEAEVAQVWEFVRHRVVRWTGDETKGEKIPEIEGRVAHGFGPSGRFTTGKILDKRDRHYSRNVNDEPLDPYIVLRPERAEDRGVTDIGAPMLGGREYFEAQLALAAKAAKPVTADERAAFEQRIRELEAMLALSKKEDAVLSSAEESEREEAREQKGRKGR